MILRARLVLPLSRPPIEDGALVIREDRIAALGRWADVARENPGREVVDLGDSILLPGLINGHCHLDYSNLAGMLPPRRSFSDWIKAIVTLKSTWSDGEFTASWQEGARMLLQSGVTTVVDVEAVPSLLPAVLGTTPLNVISCHEMISIKRDAAELLPEAIGRVTRWPNEQKGLSPHAPYSTSAGLLSATAWEASMRNWLVTMHVAESAEEFEMFTGARGAMYDWLAPQRNMGDCGRGTPVQHVAAAGALSRMLVVHANYVTPADIRLLANSQAQVVHCPRSHSYFDHQAFPYDAMKAAGINVCLGTDSLATVRRHSPDGLQLSLGAEMRAFAGAYPHVPPQEIVSMVTVNAAKALGAQYQLGELGPNAMADVVVLPWAAGADPFETVVAHSGPVRAVMIRGEWALPAERAAHDALTIPAPP